MAQRIFKRKIYSEMVKWKGGRNGSTALLIEGARRIGKSTIAEEFARNEYESYILINFTDISDDIKSFFDDIFDLDFFFVRLQTAYKVNLIPRKSVIIFDEVQLCPKARQAIKKLVADGRYDYIETGSLISIKKNIKDILIPSEETRLRMFPMDFEEFLEATGDHGVWSLIKYSFEHLKPLGDATNRLYLRKFRTYMAVGGMPYALSTYIETNNFEAVDSVKREIIQLYLEDFRKIDSSGRSSRLFEAIPAELARNTLRYKVGSVIKNATSARLEEVLMDMADSMTVNFQYHANDPSVGFALHADYSCFKLFMGDTGLFVTLAFMDRDFTQNSLYYKLITDKLSADLGYVFENVVAQMLRCAGNSLYYYTFKASQPVEAEEEVENAIGNAQAEPKREPIYEIDFLVARDNKVCPVEVKSSNYNSHKSLDMFKNKYSSRLGQCFILHTKDLRKEGDLICLPVYMAGLI